LKVSGYDAQFRLDIIKAGMKTYGKQVGREEEGVRPLYRPKGYEEEVRRKKKNRTKETWYKPNDTVLFVPPTPNGELRRRMEQVVENGNSNELRIKVVERAGRKIRSILPGLKENLECGREKCMIHYAGGRGNCNKEGIVCEGMCIECKNSGKRSIYVGETGRSAYTRGRQHMDAMDNPESYKSNAFVKHMVEEHDSRVVDFKVNVMGSYRKPLERQVREGVEIWRTEADTVMNSKMDHYQPVMRRVTFAHILDQME